MEASDDLTNAEPSYVNHVGGLNLLKKYLTSVVMDPLVLVTFKQFNAITSTETPPASDSDAKDDKQQEEESPALKESLRTLVDAIPVTTETKHTKSFCKVKQIVEAARAANLTVHPEWTFRVPRPRGSTSTDIKPRSDVTFVADESVDGEGGDDRTLLDPVTLLEFGKSKESDKDVVTDAWYAKFVHGPHD